MVTVPADALQPLIPAAQIFTQQLVQVGDYIAQQGEQVSFVANGIQFPTSQQASQYNALIGPLARSIRRLIRLDGGGKRDPVMIFAR